MASPASLSALIDAARGAANQAYAPYSKFRVGAAVRGASGALHIGCNVENASFGLTCCAERNAVFAAVAAGETRITHVVLYTPTIEPTAPCGACRQVLAEFGSDIQVLALCDGPERIETTVASLLPHPFGPGALT